MTGSINRIDLCVTVIEIRLYYLVFHISHKHFNVLKSDFYVKNLVVGQVSTLNKNEMTQKRNLVILIPSKKHDQIMNKTYNARLQSMKVLTMMKTKLTTLEIYQSIPITVCRNLSHSTLFQSSFIP